MKRNNINIGYEKLRKIREERGFSTSYIAKVLGATPKQVKRWENGESIMKLHNYIILANLYNLSLDYIAGLIDTPNTID